MLAAHERRFWGEAWPGWVAWLCLLLGCYGTLHSVQRLIFAPPQGGQSLHTLPPAGMVPAAQTPSPQQVLAGASATGASPTASQPPQPRQAAAPTDCPPIFPVAFALGRAVPQAVALAQKVALLVAWLQSHPSTHLLLHGHADASGHEDWNLKLSFQRARAMQALFHAAGLAADRMTARGFGEYQPVSSDSEEAPENRRVKMLIRGAAKGCPSGLMEGNEP